MLYPIPLKQRSNYYFKSQREQILVSDQYTTVECVEGKEIKLDFLSLSSTDVDTIPIDEPVYVIKTDSGEKIVYKSDLMELDKPYPIIWDGEYFCLVKTESDIELYKRDLDEK